MEQKSTEVGSPSKPKKGGIPLRKREPHSGKASFFFGWGMICGGMQGTQFNLIAFGFCVFVLRVLFETGSKVTLLGA